MGLLIQNSRFKIHQSTNDINLYLKFWNLGFELWILGFGIWGLGFGVWGFI
jgi:hypothetical protein